MATLNQAYATELATLAKRYPRLSRKLLEAERVRQVQLAMLQDGARLRGVDELLRHLDAVHEAFQADPVLADVAMLIQRASAEVETGTEATLSGYLAVVTDAMRDILETEMLLLDFSLEPDRIKLWLSDNATRRREFAAATLRKRLRAAGVPRFTEPSADADYKGHSEALHLSPHQHPIFLKGLQIEGDFIVPDGGFWELFQHGRRLPFAVDAVRDNVAASPWPDVPRTEELTAVEDAWTRTQEMQGVWLAMMVASQKA